MPKSTQPKILGQNANLAGLRLAIARNMPTLLIGETGTGKTSSLRLLAQEYKTVLHRVNLNGESTPYDLVGQYVVREGDLLWIDGILIHAMREGHWIVLDEVNAASPEILFILNPLLDDDRIVVLTQKDGEVVHPHPDFRIFACMNPTEEYAGTKEMNKAFLSRWPIRMTFGYLDKRQEASLLRSRTGVDATVARQIAEFAKLIREAKAEDRIYTTLSHRDTLAWASLVGELGMQEAFRLTLRDLFKREEHVEVKQAWDRTITCVENTMQDLGAQGFKTGSLFEMMQDLRNKAAQCKYLLDRENQWKEFEEHRRELLAKERRDNQQQLKDFDNWRREEVFSISLKMETLDKRERDLEEAIARVKQVVGQV